LATLSFMGWRTVDSAWSEFGHWRVDAEQGESPFATFARRVGEIAGPNAVVLGDGVLTWSIPSFGPRVVTLKHENPLVEERVAREEAVQLFLKRGTSDDERLRILEHFKVTHVVARERQDRHLFPFLEEHGKPYRLATGHRLYALAPSGHRN
jgi:hypothetical protein